MSEISSVQGATAIKAAQAQYQAAVELMKRTLEVQTEAMKQMLEAMGLGQNLDVTA